MHLSSLFWDTQWVLLSNLTGLVLRGWGEPLFPGDCHTLSLGTTLPLSFYVQILLRFSFPLKLSLLRTQAEVNLSAMALGHSSVSLTSVLGIGLLTETGTRLSPAAQHRSPLGHYFSLLFCLVGGVFLEGD